LSRNLGTLTFWNSLGPAGSILGLIYLYNIASRPIKEMAEEAKKMHPIKNCKGKYVNGNNKKTPYLECVLKRKY